MVHHFTPFNLSFISLPNLSRILKTPFDHLTMLDQVDSIRLHSIDSIHLTPFDPHPGPCMQAGHHLTILLWLVESIPFDSI